MVEVKLDKNDWNQALAASIGSLKNALAGVEVFKNQIKTAEIEIAKFPKDKEVTKEKKKTPLGV